MAPRKNRQAVRDDLERLAKANRLKRADAATHMAELREAAEKYFPGLEDRQVLNRFQHERVLYEHAQKLYHWAEENLQTEIESETRRSKALEEVRREVKLVEHEIAKIGQDRQNKLDEGAQSALQIIEQILNENPRVEESLWQNRRREERPSLMDSWKEVQATMRGLQEDVQNATSEIVRKAASTLGTTLKEPLDEFVAPLVGENSRLRDEENKSTEAYGQLVTEKTELQESHDLLVVEMDTLKRELQTEKSSYEERKQRTDQRMKKSLDEKSEDHRKTLVRLQDEYKKELDEKDSEHTKAIEEKDQDHEKVMKESKERHVEALSKKKEAYEKALEKCKAAYEKDLKEKDDEHEKALEEKDDEYEKILLEKSEESVPILDKRKQMHDKALERRTDWHKQVVAKQQEGHDKFLEKMMEENDKATQSILEEHEKAKRALREEHDMAMQKEKRARQQAEFDCKNEAKSAQDARETIDELRSQAQANELTWRSERSGLVEDVDRQKDAAGQQKDRADKAESEINELRTGLAGAEGSARNLQENVASLRAELERVKETAKRSSESEERLKHDLEVQRSSVALLNSKMEDLSCEKNRLEQTVTQVTAELGSTRAQRDDLSTEQDKTARLLADANASLIAKEDVLRAREVVMAEKTGDLDVRDRELRSKAKVIIDLKAKMTTFESFTQWYGRFAGLDTGVHITTHLIDRWTLTHQDQPSEEQLIGHNLPILSLWAKPTQIRPCQRAWIAMECGTPAIAVLDLGLFTANPVSLAELHWLAPVVIKAVYELVVKRMDQLDAIEIIKVIQGVAFVALNERKMDALSAAFRTMSAWLMAEGNLNDEIISPFHARLRTFFQDRKPISEWLLPTTSTLSDSSSDLPAGTLVTYSRKCTLGTIQGYDNSLTFFSNADIKAVFVGNGIRIDLTRADPKYGDRLDICKGGSLAYLDCTDWVVARFELEKFS